MSRISDEERKSERRVMKECFDYVIVGGGTAGAIVARRIAETGEVTVALVEAGPSDEAEPRVLDCRLWTSLLGSDLDYDYAIESQERGNSAIRQSRARVLGGCSSHNACGAVRPQPHDFEAWVRAGATGWGPDDVAPFFDRVFKRVYTERAPSDNPCAIGFVDAAREAGFDFVEFNEHSYSDGVGWLSLNKCGNLRQSSSVAYLHPMVKLPRNLCVMTDTPVNRVVVNHEGHATGVETARGLLTARREIVLCAGSLDTPKLLLLSGIGPSNHLRSLGIDVVHDLPGVGERLIDHPEGLVMWSTVKPIPRADYAWCAALFARSDPSLTGPDIMIHFGTEAQSVLSATIDDTGHAPIQGRAFCMTPNVAYPRSEGHVRLHSRLPDAQPRIDPGYFTDRHGHDERVLLAGMKLARSVAAKGPLAAWIDRELAPGENCSDDEKLSEYARLASRTVFHPAGTTRMGDPSDVDAVVDPCLRVRGLTGLRVADASVFPAAIGVNIAVTCMMIGERCADLMIGADRPDRDAHRRAHYQHVADVG
jgi:choline oxidase